MKPWVALVVLPLIIPACGEGVSLGGGAPDVELEAPVLAPLAFGDVTLVAELNSPEKDDNITLSGDRLVACFTSLREGGTGDSDVWCASRSDPTEPFDAPAPVTVANTTGFESSAAVSLDGLELWWGSADPEGVAGLDVWHSTRPDRSSPWTMAALIAELNSSEDEIPRPLGGPGNAIMPLASRRGDESYWTYLAERQGDGQFGEPALVEELAEPGVELVDAQLNPDGLILVFTYAGETTGADLYFSRRETLDAPFGSPEEIQGVNSDGDDRDPWMSPDGAHLFFSSDRSGEFEIYQASGL